MANYGFGGISEQQISEQQADADARTCQNNRSHALEQRVKFLETMLTNLCSMLDVDPVKLHDDTAKELEKAERARAARMRNGPLRIKRKK